MQVDSWKSIRQRLAPGGRVMTNLGAAPVPGQHAAVQTTQAALAAMAEAFDGECERLRLCGGEGITACHAHVLQLWQWPRLV